MLFSLKKKTWFILHKKMLWKMFFQLVQVQFSKANQLIKCCVDAHAINLMDGVSGKKCSFKGINGCSKIWKRIFMKERKKRIKLDWYFTIFSLPDMTGRSYRRRKVSFRGATLLKKTITCFVQTWRVCFQ